MEFNPDCEACTRNPYYLKQTEREKALLSEEAIAKKVSKALESHRTTVCDLLKTMNSSVEVDLDGYGVDMERLHDILRTSFQKKKEQRMESLRKKEQQQKKLLYYRNLWTRYENTRNYRQSRTHKATIKKLQSDLAISEKKNEYNELIRLVKNASLYEKIRSYWEKNRGGASSLEELRKEKEGWQRKLTERKDKIKRMYEAGTELLEAGKKKIRCEVDMEEVEKQVQALIENEKTALRRKELDANRSLLRGKKDTCIEKQHGFKTSLESSMIRKKEWENNTKMFKECQEKSRMLQCLMNCIDRDGLPLYLLRMYLPIIEDDINMLIYTFLDNKKLVLRVQEDSVVIGLQGATSSSESDSALSSTSAPSSYMGGMESFIVDLSVKMAFAKYSRLPQSNFFIIDEGISVFDQERVANIYVLFNFLTSISEHVFLISHLPTIKDFVSQSIEVDKDQDQKSHITCCF
jgi:DNA repair exonuclease SbcCD ATPase subunit